MWGVLRRWRWDRLASKQASRLAGRHVEEVEEGGGGRRERQRIITTTSFVPLVLPSTSFMQFLHPIPSHRIN
jgi:hypothetical protein